MESATGELLQGMLLRDLAVVMIVAAVVTLLCHRLRQPVVLGYLLAGAIIGPHLLPAPLIADKHSIETLAELGVVFLMFSLGLHFSLRQLKQVGTTAFIAATLEIVLMVWLGYAVGRGFGWATMDCVFLGAILSISSTTIIVKVLQDLGRTKEKFAGIIFGILIVEDILAIAMIALLSSLAMTGGLPAGEVAGTVARIGVFLVVVLVCGLLAVPPLVRYVARFKSDEMLLVTVLGLCFGVSLLAVSLGYSVALGAFVIGTILGEAREIGQIRRLTEPVRDMFSAVFFVAIGMLIDPALLVAYWRPVVVVTLTVVAGKVVSGALGTFVAGHDTRTSMRVGMGLAQIGEFSFIIASLGLTLRVTSEFLYPIAVAVSAVTTLLTPYLIRSSDPVVGWFDRVAPRWLVGALGIYSNWLERLRAGRHENQGRQLARRWSWQIVLNVLVVSGVFVVAVAVAPRAERWWPDAPDVLGGAKGLVWLATAVVTLPGLIAAVRKLQALALLLSEMNVGKGMTAPAVRTIIYHTVFAAGTLGIGLWVLALSSTLLPAGPALVALLLMVVLMTILLWRYFIQIHARAQVALRETLAAPPAPAADEPAALPTLRGAQLEAVTIGSHAPAAGKLIRELELRTKTGASIVAIERGETQLINPGPDEELKADDRVLLLGTREHLAAARQLLTTP